MVFSLVERQTGNVVGSFDTQSEADEYAGLHMEPSDEWALFEFGPAPTDNRLVMASHELFERAMSVGGLVAIELTVRDQVANLGLPPVRSEGTTWSRGSLVAVL